MDRNLLKNTAQRLNVYDESVIKKTEEYLRLYQTKASMKTLNDQAKTVLCLDLASQFIGKGFDKEMALTLCGLRKSAYQNSLYILEKVLDLDKTLTVSDLCVQLGCTIIKEDAENILSKYKNVDSNIKDLDHPQYVVAATYLACKAKRISVDKPKLVSMSRLKSSQWKELISAFESMGLNKSPSRQKLNEHVKNYEIMVEIDNHEVAKNDGFKEVEEYAVWKSRILKEAYAALGKESQMEH